MKFSKRAVTSREHAIPALEFEDQKLTSYAGLVVFQEFFKQARIKEGLRKCFGHLKSGVYGHHIIMLVLIVHLLLGYRKLRDLEYYKDDPMVKRLLGLRRLPDVSTVSRALRSMDREGVSKTRELNRERIMRVFKESKVKRLTTDFDGSVLVTQGRNREGTAVGYNKKKKGARSYYPLFCTLAQTGQVFDVHHRPGNVHDSNGAEEFIRGCVSELRRGVPGVTIEARMDSAFFSDAIVTMLQGERIEFTLSVPFERFAELKGMIEGRQRWRRLDKEWSYFETNWKPKAWDKRYRFIFIRQKSKKMHPDPVQLDMFVPQEYGYEFKVIVTNKTVSAKKVLMFHNGRASQESIFGELKSQSQGDYIAVRKLHGNQMYLMAAVMAHNLNREMQMTTMEKQRGTTEKRSPLWIFEELATIRQRLLHRAGRLTMPQGKLTLTMSANEAVKESLLSFLEGLKTAA